MLKSYYISDFQTVSSSFFIKGDRNVPLIKKSSIYTFIYELLGLSQPAKHSPV